jgi:uncharacterized membrane protein
MKHITLFIKRIIGHLKSFFISGLLTILPLILTIALFSFSLKIVKSWLAPLSHFQPAYLKQIPHSEIILAIIVIIGLGIILRVFLLHPLIHAAEVGLGKIPLLRPVYFGIKQLVNALSSQDKFAFQQVVLVEFPRTGIYSLGFITGTCAATLSPHKNSTFVSIFIPTTPNPTTGFYIITEQNSYTLVNITRQEAMTVIISGGIIQPTHFNEQTYQTKI